MIWDQGHVTKGFHETRNADSMAVWNTKSFFSLFLVTTMS